MEVLVGLLLLIVAVAALVQVVDTLWRVVWFAAFFLSLYLLAPTIIPFLR